MGAEYQEYIADRSNLPNGFKDAFPETHLSSPACFVRTSNGEIKFIGGYDKTAFAINLYAGGGLIAPQGRKDKMMTTVATVIFIPTTRVLEMDSLANRNLCLLFQRTIALEYMRCNCFCKYIKRTCTKKCKSSSCKNACFFICTAMVVCSCIYFSCTRVCCIKNQVKKKKKEIVF